MERKVQADGILGENNGIARRLSATLLATLRAAIVENAQSTEEWRSSKFICSIVSFKMIVNIEVRKLFPGLRKATDG